MARHDLIAPTGAMQAAEAGRRRRAAGFAILSAGALLAVLGVSAVFGGERPAAPDDGGGGLATSAAKLVAEIVASPIFYLVAGVCAAECTLCC